MSGIGVEAIAMTMRFGAFTALDDVSIKVRANSFHALLGENGAGKSTLVKCMMGFYRPSEGQMLVAGQEAAIGSPRDAAALGLGMVYQHFTLVASLTGAENLVIARTDTPGVIHWARERERLAAFMATMPFKVALDTPISQLAAGEKQKLEIIKQLYLGRRFIVLDEPTSVLTPGEADEVLGHVRGMTRSGGVTVLMISHKFREVFGFADEVTVLRRGRKTGGGPIGAVDQATLAKLMVGEQTIAAPAARSDARCGRTVLAVDGLKAERRSGAGMIDVGSLAVRAGEIVGIAGISGNGQTEFLETLAGQRALKAGAITVNGAAYRARRDDMRSQHIRFIPEEPLRGACAPRMSVAENLAFRSFDLGADGRRAIFLDRGAMRRAASALIGRFGVKTASLDTPIAALSGGNVQRAVLARELTGAVDLLIVANPCFGLDFAAVADIRARLIEARNAGAAVLIVSEDLDELLELSDRILVMANGAIVYETPAATADVLAIGRAMAGHP